MANTVKLTIDGKPVEAPAGMLVIEAARRSGIEIPAFCYYEGMALQAACRMCLVEVEKAPKLLTACTLPVAEGMVVHTDTPKVAEARKSMLEFLLTNHPLDCPVCDKGGECELQDMVFRYGAGQSRFLENKQHVDEEQWSPVVFFDRPRCILCFRCVRVCGEGMGVSALGVINRGALSEIAPNEGDHLKCDECGNCIDICPVGALTSGMYRYRTRPWEMEHAATICTHCSNGCKVTLGVRNGQIQRGNNRDRSGINGEFLCLKGRYAGDFTDHPERLYSPLVRQPGGSLEPVTWAQALETVAARLGEIKGRGGKIGIIGSNHTTNEENFYLQKLARVGLGTPHIDHHRTGDVVSLMDALSGRQNALATTDDLYKTKAVLIVASDLSQQHPLLAWQVRANLRHHRANVYVVRRGPVREDHCAKRVVAITPGQELRGLEELRGDLSHEPELVIVFGDAVKGAQVRELVAFGDSLGIPVKYVCLVDYSNSRGAQDMGLLPDLGPGYQALEQPGMSMEEMLASEDLDALWVVGANPLARHNLAARDAFVVVNEMFLTETAARADVVLPAASAYEKGGTVTSVCGEVQRLRVALQKPGTKTDLEIFGLVAREMRLDLAALGPWTSNDVFREISNTVRGYHLPFPILQGGAALQAVPLNGRVGVEVPPERIASSGDTLFTSGTLGRYSKTLNSVIEGPGELYHG
ncbi:MAG TPA: NADH-quinone oxidoreductase subunit NuoG [Bryobacteraceae bacterium]|nr:NADH-quinone oxidoreductase subunit NuoG [Bryobacteraceae bacterium]